MALAMKDGAKVTGKPDERSHVALSSIACAMIAIRNSDSGFSQPSPNGATTSHVARR